MAKSPHCPKFIVAGLLAWRGQATAAFGALISSKINQWSLLVGMIPLVYSLASGVPNSLHLDPHQTQELWLTAAQSLYAMGIMLNLYIGKVGAAALFGLFAVQFLLPDSHMIISIVYLLFAAYLIVRDREHILPLFRNGLLP